MRHQVLVSGNIPEFINAIIGELKSEGYKGGVSLDFAGITLKKLTLRKRYWWIPLKVSFVTLEPSVEPDGATIKLKVTFTNSTLGEIAAFRQMCKGPNFYLRVSDTIAYI